MANNKKKTGGISVAEFMAGKNPGHYEQKQTVGGKSYTPDADSLTGEKQTRATAAEKFFGQFGLKMPEISDAKRDAILAKEDAEKAYQKYYNIYNRNTKSATNVAVHKAHGEDWKQQEYDAYVEYLKAQQRQTEAEEANWAEVEQSTDFAQTVEKGRTAYAKWAYQQDNKNFLGNVKESAWKMGARIANIDPNYNRPDARWSQQEWNRFYMYMGTDESRAWKYAAQVNDKYNAQQIEAEKQNVRDTMKWDDNNLANWGKANLGFWSGIVNDPFNVYDYLTTLGQTAIMGEPHRRGHATPADILNTASESQANQMQKDLHFDESIPFIGGKGAGDAFQLAQSIVKSGMYAYLGRGMGDYPVIGNPTTLLMGGGAANQTYQNAKARGASEWQALALGGIEGLVEAATEKYSIEALLADPKNLAVFIAKQAFTEGSEEIAATVLDSFADNLVMRDKSEFNQAVYMYMANGLSPEDAKKRAYIDWAVGATWDFIGGALSGGISGAGRIGLSSVMNYGGDSQYLLDLANQTPEDSAARKYAEQFQKTFDKRGSLSSLQGSRLEEYTIEALNEADKPALVTAAAEQLKKSGVTDATAKARADVIVDAALRASIGQESKSFKNETEQRVYTELLAQLNDRNASRSGWVDTKDLAWTRAETAAKEKAETRSRAVETKSGEKGQVTRAIMTDDGLKLEVQTESGTKQYSQGDLNLSEGQQLSLSSLSQILGKDAAAAYNGMSFGQINFGDPLSVIRYANAWASVRDKLAGKTEAEMLKSDLRNGLTDIQAIQAWKAGQNRTATVEVREKARRGSGQISVNGAVLNGGKDSNGNDVKIKLQGVKNPEKITNYKRYKVLKALCEAMHINCVLFDSSRSEGKGKDINGAYIDGTIYLDWAAMKEKGGRLFSSTDVMFRAMSHELTHFIQQQAPQEYAELKSFVTDYLSEKMGKDYNDLVTEKMWREYDSDTGYVLSRSAAEDEVVADACETMLRDSEYVQKMFEKNRSLFDKISGWVHKFLRQIEAADIGAKELQPVIKQVRDLWDAGLRAAVEGENAQAEAVSRLSEGGQKIVESLGENAEIQVDKNGDMETAKSEDGKTVAFSMKTYDEGGKDKLIQALKENGHTQEEIDAVIESIEATGDFLEKLAQQYSDSHDYQNLKRNLWAGITTNLKTGKQIISALVNNGDYPVNIDLQLICKKRVAYMRMLTRLIDDGVFEKVDFKGAAIADLNAILRDGGFETACLGCFVESRRLQLQAWAETIVEEWNDEVDKRKQNAGSFNFAQGGNKLSAEDILNLSMELENAGKKNDKGNLNLGKGSVKVKMGRLLDKVPSLAQHLTVADLLTPDGLKTLRAYDQNLFSLVKQRYGAASPKIVQDFNPYNSEMADLSFQFVKKMIGESVTGSKKYTDQAKKELPRKKGESTAEYNRRVETLAVRKYLYDIGGARIQSFSDFMIENVFDYMQIVADLAARELPLHGYSKEAVFLRLFGMTGGKFNGSLIAHVESKMGKEYAGLLPVEEASNGRGLVVEVDGEKYAICFDDYARHVATGSFIQSIGLKDIVALQLDPRYSKNVGSITIGVSDKQILAMLDSPYFRMVIPYHASGMIPEFAKLVGVNNYNDYTDYQTTKVAKCFDLKGNPVEGFWNADGEKVKIDTHFDFNEAVQRLGDARAAANEYLEWCKQRHPVYDGKKLVGYATYQAKFSDSPYGTDFTQHENYYKLLEDFNSYDSIGEASALQGAVTMTLPSEANRLTPEQMDAYKQSLRDTGLFTEKEIEKYAKKADMTFQELIQEEIGNRAEYESKQAKVWDETVDKAEQMLLEKYGRVQMSVRNGVENLSPEEYANSTSKETANEKVQFSFAGGRAKTANSVKLKMARDYESEGMSRSDIFLKTGWFRGLDRQWRFEIDNSEMKLADAYNPNVKAYELDQLIEHPELFDAYPELKRVHVLVEKLGPTVGGVYYPGQRLIRVNDTLFDDKGFVVSILAHEIQHAIQNIEGFTPGASAEYWENADWGDREWLNRLIRNKEKDLQKAAKELDEALKDTDYDSFQKQQDDRIWNEEITEDEAEKEYRRFVEKNVPAGGYLYGLIKQAQRDIEQARKQLEAIKSPAEKYRNTAGEIEARDVQERLSYNKAQRRLRMPNVPTEGVYYARNDYKAFSTKVQQSVRSNAKTDREMLLDFYERIVAQEQAKAKHNEDLLKKAHEQTYNMKQQAIERLHAEQKKALEDFRKAVDRYEAREREVTQALQELDRLVQAGDNPAAIQQARAKVNAKEAQLASAVDNLTKSMNASEIQKILQQERRIERQRTREKMEESSGRRQALGRVKAKAGELYEMLTTNSDKVHVPEILKAPLAEFLEGISIPVKETYKDRKTGEVKETRSHQNFAARLLQLTKIVENQQKYIAGDPSIKEDLGSYLDISDESLQFLEDCSEMITQAMAEAGSFTIDQMNAEQLRDLAKFLSNLKTAIRNMNSFMANERFASVREAASADIIELDKMRASQNKADAKYPSGVLWKNGTPYYIFKRFGEGGRSIFKGFTKGWGQMAFNAREIIEYTRQTYTDKEVKAWKKQTHSITLEDGHKITMTTGQIMELAMLLGREQAVKHVNAGGIRIGDIDGRSDTTHYHLTDGDVQEILGKLNERQMDVAKKLQRFMADKGAEWGNEISMKRFGYRFYDEGPGYYPIRTDANDRPMADTDIQKNSMFRLLNLSSSKKINPKASNALVVGDIFDTFADHMADMAKLHGMGLPILDAIKWFNFKERVDRDDGTYDTRTIQGSLERALGKSAGQYFRTLMKDINGQTENGDRGTGLLSFFTSKFKAAAVGGNLRVALLQPTAYVRASTVIKPIYLAAAMGNLRGSIFAAGTAKAAWREAMKYSGEMVWKDIGGYNTDLARSMRAQIQHDDGWMDKITEASMLGAEWGDKLTWGRIWMACKLQAQAENRGIGHEELMKKTEELFNEVIYSSQVMDSTLTRSELMRSRSQADKLLTAFMAEPTVSFNILMDSASDYHLASKKYGRQAAWVRTRAKLGKAFAVYLSSAAAAALVESLADAMRDDDDEEYWKKFLEALLGEETAKKIWGEEPGKNDKGLMSGNLMQDLSILGKLPVAKDLINIASGYKASNMSLDAFTNLFNVYKIWIETIELNNGTLDKATSTTYYGKMTTWGKIYKSLQALSQLSGLPASNVTRDATAIWNTVMNGWKDEWKIRTYDADQLSQTKVNDYKAIVAPTGLSLKQFQTMYREMNADGNSSVTQAEAGEYLRDKVKSRELTMKQAEAVWNASVNGKTSFEQWLEKNK